MSVNTLQKAALATTAYFDLFDYALTVDELEQMILGENHYSRDHLMRYLSESPKFCINNGLVHFNGREHLVALRKEKTLHAQKLWEKTQQFARILSWIPFIKAVFVCNNLAYSNPHAGSDIDLFIITKRKRLFFARTLITLITHLSGHRRYGNKIKERFCLSFFVSEDAMNMAKIALKPKDIYLAYWTLTLRPILDRNCLEDFERTNQTFIKKYFPGSYFVKRDKMISVSQWSKRFVWCCELVLGSFIGAPVEQLLKWWQLRRAEKKRQQLDDASGIILSDQMLKFHNVDRRASVLARWNQRVHRGI